MSDLDQAEGFEWDDDEVEEGNTQHLAEHNITPYEAECAYQDCLRLQRNRADGSGDWKVIGRTDAGRMLTLIFTYDEIRRMIRIFTGWNSTTGERSGL